MGPQALEGQGVGLTPPSRDVSLLPPLRTHKNASYQVSAQSKHAKPSHHPKNWFSQVW